ncbi:MAG: 4-hydroxythreonine-4-phosphate dehydrogenase PdxA [Methylococcaceae bacterium]
MNNDKSFPRIALTPGEPSGIGPDICLQLADLRLPCELVLIADPELLSQRVEQLGLKVNFSVFDAKNNTQAPHQIKVMPIKMEAECVPGKPNKQNAPYVLKTIRKATLGCLNKTFDAMVTGPVQKGIINEAGIPFSGHTEYIAEMTGGYPVMMLATPGLRVALVTIHLPLSQVSGAITSTRVRNVLRVLHQDLLQRFGLENPKILVCGLNPHAGENGFIGHEEIKIINPVIDGLKQQGWNVHGPLPADTLFTPDYLSSADAVLAMYHDQGLPVLKHMGFGKAVNITLGLPIIRTSVDHGTALDLAGTGKADTGSLQYALETAIEMINYQRLQVGA